MPSFRYHFISYNRNKNEQNRKNNKNQDHSINRRQGHSIKHSSVCKHKGNLMETREEEKKNTQQINNWSWVNWSWFWHVIHTWHTMKYHHVKSHQYCAIYWEIEHHTSQTKKIETIYSLMVNKTLKLERSMCNNKKIGQRRKNISIRQ